MDNDINKRLSEVESGVSVLDAKLTYFKENRLSIVDKLERVIDASSKASVQFESSAKRIEECVDKVADAQESIHTIQLSMSQHENALAGLKSDVVNLNTSINSKLESYQVSLKVNTDAITSLQNAQNNCQLKNNGIMNKLVDDTNTLKTDVSDIKNRIAEMEKVKTGWTAIKYICGIIISAILGVLTIKEILNISWK